MSDKKDVQSTDAADKSNAAGEAAKAKDPTAKDIKRKVQQPEESQQPDQSAEIDELKAQLSSMEDKYLRAQAEIANIQQRQQKETAQLMKYDGQQLAHDVVPELDNLERALQTEVNDESAKQLKHGVDMVYGHLQNALKENNVTEIEALNKTFDPTLHQAVQTTPVGPDQKPDTVVAVLQKGYMLKDRVLRPAMVVVAQ
ncbi:MAG TPA: nucleotide exchange factor GrpE [Lactobacillus sp.]|nr:nucleotide exchange factor GrpE [Lactobacillus sp.]